MKELIVDTREPVKDIVPLLDKLGVPHIELALEAGDYDCDGITIERKAINDFYLSITEPKGDPRLFNQIPRLAEVSSRPILAITGDEQILIDNNIDYNPNVLYGTIASLMVRYGVEVLWLRDDWALMNVLANLFQKVQEGKEGLPWYGIKTGRYSNPDLQRKAFITGLHGVSPILSDRILLHFGSVRAFVSAEVKEMLRIEGIGLHKAEHFYNVFNGIYGEKKDAL